uniref:Uncharacterized protein AlNc14C5G773 n=1 Tax=Albugo laibachii Nc14 TaxID=890382 RepID=F0W0Z3_9STRA|nr:cleavage induced conserved hypothetical protein [Albugo laibachii Nc14]|eukprot:CCA14717.1 cleavage induced conserved hypothetical protein [Albugo laibachii Nc14]
MHSNYASRLTSTAVDAASVAALELEHVIGLSSIPNAIHLHPSNQFVYAAGGSIVSTALHDAHQQSIFQGHKGHISCLAVSPSGRFITSGAIGSVADVLVWDFMKQKLLYRLCEHDHGVAALAFSEDDRLLCSVGNEEDARLFVWDLRTGNICATQQKIHAAAVAFVGDRNGPKDSMYQLITAGNRILRFWMLDPLCGTLSYINIEQALVRNFTCIQVAPTRQSVLIGSTSGDFAVVDVASKRIVKTVSACSGGVQAIAFINGCVCIGGGDGTILQFTNDFIDISATQLDTCVIGLSIDQGRCVAATKSGAIYLLDVNLDRSNQIPSRLISENHSNDVISIKFASSSPISDRFATIANDLTIRIWDVSEYRVLVKCSVNDGGRPTSFHYSPHHFISGWSDGCVRCHDAQSESLSWTIGNAHSDGITAIVLSQMEHIMITGGQGGEIRVWDLRKRMMISQLKQHTMAITQLVLYKDDTTLLSSSRDRSIICWDLQQGRRSLAFTQRMGGILAIALSLDEKTIMSVGQDKAISFWEKTHEEAFLIRNAHLEQINCIGLAHTLLLFATGGNDHLVKLWNAETREFISEKKGHSGNVRSLAFSPDDRQLISVGEDGCILIWNVYTQ